MDNFSQINEAFYNLMRNKATRSELEALQRMIRSVFKNMNAEEFYLKPLDGIPERDLSDEIKVQLEKINKAYMQGKPIKAEDLPENVVNTEMLQAATTGRVHWLDSCKNIIDEVVVARDGQAGITLLGNINRRALKSEIIATINATEEAQKISKTKIEDYAHSDITHRDEADCHPSPAISHMDGETSTTVSAMLGSLKAALAMKANMFTLIEEINAYAGEALISATKLDLNVSELLADVQHNDLDGRDEADCHPASAITYDDNGTGVDLQTYLDGLVSGGGDISDSDIHYIIGGLPGVDGYYDPASNYGTIDDRLKCLEELISQIITQMQPPIPPPQCIQRPPGWFN